MTEPLILAIDQGTSATKCLLMTASGEVIKASSVPIGIVFPRPGWVEQDPLEVVASVVEAARQCLQGTPSRRVQVVGLSTQRESAMIWDRRTGLPLGPLLGWQDLRTADRCRALREAGHGAEVRRLSGLPLDPMFSAAKLAWLLATVDPTLVLAGHVAFGTVDSWLLATLTGRHVIEAGNASRTQLLDVSAGRWSPELLEIFQIPQQCLPEVVPSRGDFGECGSAAGCLQGLPVRGVLGDSHAALRAHGNRADRAAKVTYGTGSSVMRVGRAVEDDRVCHTIAWADPLPVQALEGNVRSSGATIGWLGELLGASSEEIAGLAASADSGGVHLVPAFTGLGAPWWDEDAVGLVCGLTQATGQSQLARAALESVAFQVDDVVRAMTDDGQPDHLLADGGASANDVLMQLQADFSGLPVLRARARDLSAIGVGLLAGNGLAETVPLEYDEFRPGLDAEQSAVRRSSWLEAVERSRGRPAEPRVH